ncbi:MAG: ROK family protein [Lachnospiraceae bacterium]|nr:ROK family protein [Lachnospiraceae bacterium]
MYRVGIDLGKSDIRIGIIDEQYKIVYHDVLMMESEKTYQDTIKEIAEFIQDAIHKSGIGVDDLTGIGVGCPGAIDGENGCVVLSRQLNWRNVPFVKELHKYINYPIAISNDANCVALGEVKAGAAKNLQNVVLLTFKIGVGGGIISNGKIFEGGHAGGAELGHTLLVRDGITCECGRRGCLEAYASVEALKRQVQEAAGRHPESLLWESHKDASGEMKISREAFWRAVEREDTVATEVLQTYISYLGDGIVDFVNIFQPDRVLLSECPTEDEALFLEPLNTYVKTYCFVEDKSMVPGITGTLLGNRAGIIGAAALTEE